MILTSLEIGYITVGIVFKSYIQPKDKALKALLNNQMVQSLHWLGQSPCDKDGE